MTTCGEDRIEIRNLVVTTVVGVLAHEREIAQPLRIDLSLFVDLRDAGRRSPRWSANQRICCSSVYARGPLLMPAADD